MSAVAPCSFEKSDNAIKSIGAMYIAIKDMKAYCWRKTKRPTEKIAT
jgi:hypothetical protein